MSHPHPPVVILSGHRVGSSAAAGLLQAAGLWLGPTLAATRFNPAGHFEAEAILREHRRLLASMDRDWTCPPRWIDSSLVDPEALQSALDEIRSDGPWGWKDPRTLFLLSIWTSVLSEFRFVGVFRPTAQAAASIQRRDGIPAEAAWAIADAYTRRLAQLRAALGFPVIAFGVEGLDFIDQVRNVAELLDLSFQSSSPGEVFDSRFITVPPGGELTEWDEQLLAAARQKPTDAPVSGRAEVLGALRQLDDPLLDSLRKDLGPAFRAGTRDCLQRARQASSAVGKVLIITNHPSNGVVDLPEVLQLPAKDPNGWPGPFTHIVGHGVLDEIDPVSLSDWLRDAVRQLDPGGILAVSGWVTDGDVLPHDQLVPAAATTAHRDRPPYLHHRDELEVALLPTDKTLADVVTRSNGRTLLVVGTPEVRRPGIRTPAELRAAARRSERELRDSRDELNRLRQERTHLKEIAGRVADAEARAHRLEQAKDRAHRRIAELEAELIRLKSEAETQSNLLRVELAESRRKEREATQQSQALQAELEKSRQEAKRRLAEQRRTAERVRSLEKKLATVNKRYERLRHRRVVRLALSVANLAAPLFKFVRAVRKRKSSQPAPPSSSPQRHVLNRSELVRRITEARPDRNLTSGPLVSIIVLTRNGSHHLRRLLPGLAATTYRSFELIVVDNGSDDDTGDLLRGTHWPFPIHVISHDYNTSFSEGNNEAAGAANGDFLLFLNNDIEPINPGWLGEMVDVATKVPDTSAVGALLVYPLRGATDDHTVQHQGIIYRFRDGAPHAANLGGDDPTDPGLASVWSVPAVTAAAMMVPKEAFERVGGFRTEYVYGTEDVDLCLRLRQLGEIRLCGKAALFHHESATQSKVASELTRINRLGNWQVFAELWSPTLSRSIRSDQIKRLGRWTRSSGKVAITLTRDDPAAGWGDYYTAHELGNAFSAAGWEVVYAERYKDRWYELNGDVDLVISLLDAFDMRKAPPGALTVAWVRNWVERWLDRPWFESIDLVVASSDLAARAILERTGRHVPTIPLATNPERFHPGRPNPTFAADYAFTGNNWGAGRKLIPLLDVRPQERFLLFGKGWDSDPRVSRYWRGHLSYELLPELYSSVKIVLDDTADPTLPHGFLNGRVFDALAAGALVLTDNETGAQELFDGLLPVYRDRRELRELLDRYLDSESERTELVNRLRERVLAEYTYDRLPQRFVDAIEQWILRPRLAFKIGAPNWDEAKSWGDYHFARAMAAELSRLGFETEIHTLPEWDRADRQAVDVVVHLRGLTTYAPKPCHVNVLWIISHPDDITESECEKYDLVFVASEPHARELAERVSVPVMPLLQATDTSRFHDGDVDPALACDVLFVGNSRGKRRVAVDWALEAGLDLKVYGRGWDGLIPDDVVEDVYFPNEELARLYRSAKVVLNDHWPDMARHGFISNRVFDVLSSGGVIVSDRVKGLEELFGAAVPTFGSQSEFNEVLKNVLSDLAAARARAREAAGLVRREHSFAQRAQTLVSYLRPYLEDRALDLDGHRLNVDQLPGFHT